MTVKFLDLKKQYNLLKEEIDEAVKNVFSNGSFIGGNDVSAFEDSFSKYCGTKHCITCGNGTDGLTILLKAMDLPEKSSVIVPANTFAATAEAVVNNGLNIIFCDVDDDHNISPESVEKLTGESVSAVIAVHLYGQPAKMNKLKHICNKRGIKLIEDAAQAHGAEIEGIKVGNFGDAAVFSFYPGKVLGAAGDAGAVVTNSGFLAERIRLLTDHGRKEKHTHLVPGFNSRMDTLQAAILNVKLKYLDKWIERRNFVADTYIKELRDHKEITLPFIRKNIRHSWHLFTVRVKNRDKLIKHLKKNDIEYGIHYPSTLPEQPAFKAHLDQCKNYKALLFSSETVSVPIGEHLTNEDIFSVIRAVKNFF